MSYLIILAVGIFSVAWWPLLPSAGSMLVVICCALPLCVAAKFRHLLCLLIGISWGVLCGHLLIERSLPTALDGHDFVVTGTIVGLVDSNAKRSRFAFVVDSARLLPKPNSSPSSSQPLGVKKILISWYGNRELLPGQRWQFVARLRQPRGFVNPQAFDYQLWLYQQGFGATGYVRSSHPANKLSSKPAFGLDSVRSAPAILASALRTKLRERIDRAELSPRGRAVILALTIGDKQRLTDWWQDLSRMGIVHLLVISGLHIGLIALLGTVIGAGLVRLIILCRQFLYRIGVCTYSAKTLSGIAPLGGLVAAFLYSLLAGFSLPTQRALIAVSVVVVARLCYRKIAPLLCMSWALLFIAMAQPLAVLSAGFWLSFTAVGLLIWWFAPWQTNRPGVKLHGLKLKDLKSKGLKLKDLKLNDLKLNGLKLWGFAEKGSASSRWWWRTVSAQLALLVAMLVPLLLFVGKVSWLAPLVNLVAIPWVSLVIVPLSLLGAFIPSDALAEMLWCGSDHAIAVLWWLLDRIPAQLGFVVSPVPVTPLSLAAVILAGVSFLLPKGLKGRWIGALPLAIYVLFPNMDIALRLTVLDVGQGLAVTVETQNHTLVYDTAVEYSKQFSAGSGIIAPYLWRQARERIDTTIISHEDADHSAGFPALQEVLPSQRLLHGPAVAYPQEVVSGARLSLCSTEQRWTWDTIKFQILVADNRPEQGNNSSCVLLISFTDSTGRHSNILLPGDIERSAELALLELDLLDKTPLNLLVAPHHGSKTSSTRAFVEYFAPQHVVFSAGYRHHFGHPHKTVVDRYRESGATLWNTAEQGAMVFSWLPSGELRIQAARHRQRRWWR